MTNIDNVLQGSDGKSEEEFASSLNTALTIIEARFTFKTLKLIQASETSREILKIIQEHKGITTTHILNYISLSRGNLYRHLNRLEATRLIERRRTDVRLSGNAELYHPTGTSLAEMLGLSDLSFLEKNPEGRRFLAETDKLLSKVASR